MAFALNDSKQTVVIIWRRFGPYHLARLRGATDELANHGWQVIGLEIAGSDHYDWKPISNKELSIRTLFKERQYESIAHSEIRRSVFEILDEINPGAIAINGWSVPEAVAAARWCHSRKRFSILMSESFQPSKYFWKEWVKRSRVRRFGSALVGGRWHRDYLVKLGFLKQRVEIGYDAVDNDYFCRNAKGASKNTNLKDSFNFPKHYFFANTRFLPRKQIDVLLNAYCRLLRSTHSTIWDLVISGSGEMESDWKALSKNLKIEDRVHWPGFVQYERLPLFYGRASAFVHIAKTEAWGLVVNEAAACGLPLIVGNNVGASCELVQDGENGFLVDSQNTEQVAEAMKKLTSMSTHDRELMGQRARDIVAEFGPERFGRGLFSALEKSHTPNQ